MSDTSTSPSPTTTAASEACGACEHPWDAHDALGARYCTATMASSREARGCICLRGTQSTTPARLV